MCCRSRPRGEYPQAFFLDQPVTPVSFGTQVVAADECTYSRRRDAENARSVGCGVHTLMLRVTHRSVPREGRSRWCGHLGSDRFGRAGGTQMAANGNSIR